MQAFSPLKASLQPAESKLSDRILRLSGLKNPNFGKAETGARIHAKAWL